MQLKWNSPIVRILGSAILLGFLAYQIDLNALYQSVKDISVGGLLGTVLLGLGLMIFTAYRWSLLVDRKYRVPVTTFIKLTFYSAFAGLFMPGTIGSEAVRVGGLATKTNITAAAASVIVDRMLSLIAQFILAFAALAVGAMELHSDLQYWAAGGLAVMLGGVFMMMNRSMRSLLLQMLRWHRLAPVRTQLERFFEALDIYRDRKLLVIAMIFAFLLQIFRGVFLWACALAIGADISVGMFLVALPLVSLVEIAPISVAGVGPREAAFSVVLSQFGIATEESVATSLLAFITGTILASVIGFAAMSILGLTRDLVPNNSTRR